MSLAERVFQEHVRGTVEGFLPLQMARTGNIHRDLRTAISSTGRCRTRNLMSAFRLWLQ